MRFKLFGTKFFVSFPFCAVMCAVLYIDKTGLIMPTLLAAAIHEAGHLFALWAYECPPAAVDLIPAGVRITKRAGRAKENVYVCALSGPLLNLAVAVSSGLNFYLYNRTFVLYFAVINGMLCVFNLLPCLGLDGGTVLLNLLCRRLSPFAAQNIMRAISLLFVLLCITAVVGLYFRGIFNLSLLFAAFYLLLCAVCVVRE